MNDAFKDALDRFEDYAEADRRNREDALDDLQHIAGDQWDARVRSAREQSGRPILTVNKLPQFVNQIAGDIRMSQPAIEPVPVDDQTDPIMTEIMAGLVRQIEYQSKASTVYAWGAQCAIACGIGHWQVVTEYADDTTFDQDIRLRRIMDPLAVTWEAGAIEIDRSDASECFVSEFIPEEVFKRTYKADKVPNDFPEAKTNGASNGLFWRDTVGERVRIASHYWKEPVKKKIGLTVDGKVIDLDGISPQLWRMMGILKAREVTSHKVMHAKLSGEEYLEEPKEWAGKHIPIVPVIGNEMSVNGSIIRHGIVRFAKDPQRLYNYFRSAQAELIGTQPKAPYVGTARMFEGLEGLWNRANVDNLPYLPFNPDPDAPGGRPQREAPPQGSAAMYQEVQIAENDLYGTTGIYPTSLGQKSNESSGRAILARERQADTGSFIYQDNFRNGSMVRTGEILLDLIPRVYDSTRVVRIMGNDGLEKMASINMIVNDPFGGPKIINDLSSAKFDVRVKVGTAYANAREQMLEYLNQLVSANPQLMQVFGDLYFESMDFPGANKLAARMKKTMPAQIVGEGGMMPPQNPAAEQAAQMQFRKMAADTAKVEAEAQGKQIDNAHKAFQFGTQVDAPLTPQEPAPTGQ